MIIIFERIEKNLLLITRKLYYWFPNVTSKTFVARKIGVFHSNLPFSCVLYLMSSLFWRKFRVMQSSMNLVKFSSKYGFFKEKLVNKSIEKSYLKTNLQNKLETCIFFGVFFQELLLFKMIFFLFLKKMLYFCVQRNKRNNTSTLPKMCFENCNIKKEK